MTTIYLAGAQSGQAIEPARRWDWTNKPMCILISFAYLDVYRPVEPYFARARGFMLDSGAFTSYTLGKAVDHDALLAEVLKPKWTEAVGLDVIGSWQGSVDNAKYQLSKGITKAMPVFHIGDPWDVLAWYCANFPKVGLSCRFGEDVKTSMRFYDQCFARAWPHKFHSFGWIDERALVATPFHSADAASWVMQPAAYRSYPFKGKGKWTPKQLPIDYNLKLVSDGIEMNMDRYWRIEQQLKAKWSREMQQLETPAP